MTQTLERPAQGEPGEPRGARGLRERGAPVRDRLDDEARISLLRIIVVVLLGLGVAALAGVAQAVLVVLALIVMIMLHELGHFLTAKWGGMKVTEFFVGFGPRIWSIRKGETEYGIKAIPAGGYVKIIGMHNLDHIEDAADEPRTYRQQPFPQRLAVAVAGSTMHFLIAFVLFVIVNAVVGVPTLSTRIGSIEPLDNGPSPAARAGIEVGDRILAVDGTRIDEWEQVRAAVAGRIDQPITVTIERGGRVLDVIATPVDGTQVTIEGRVVTERRRGFLGVGPSEEFRTVNPIVAVGRSTKQFFATSYDDPSDVAPSLIVNAKALAGVVSPSGMASYFRTVTGKEGADSPDSTRFLSPVGFVRVADQAASRGLFEVMVLLIAINLFVGLFNMLPLLPLDGGHLAIAVYELIRERFRRGQRYFTDVTKLLPVTYVVVMLMLFLGVSALYLDIVRPLNFR